MHEELTPDDFPKAKAEWRRANSRRAVAHSKASKCWALSSAQRRGRRATAGAAANHALRACVAPRKRTGAGAVNCALCGRAEWHEAVGSWFRLTLNEQLEVARASSFCGDELELDQPHLWERCCSGQEDELALQCALLEQLPPMGLPPPCLSRAGTEEHPAAQRPSSAPPQAPSLRPRRPEVTMVDAAVQCFPDEMLVPMYKMRVHQRAAVRKLGAAPCEEEPCQSLCERYGDAAPLVLRSPYSVESHFSLYEDATVMAAFASGLERGELEALAGRFLGRAPRSAEDARPAVWVAGVEVQRKPLRQPRRVPERHVLEAAALRGAAPGFAQYLLKGARELLVYGLEEPPLCGRSLLSLALWDPPQWARLAHTALDFTARLIVAGVLPHAFASELLAGFARLPQTEEACKMLVLGLVTMLPAARSSNTCQRLFRSESCRTPERRPVSCFLFKTHSAPAALVSVPAQRSTGTSLRPQEHEASHTTPCRVSFGTTGGLLGPCCSRTGGVVHEVIPSRIDPADLPAYWREAAGGSLSQEELERRAVEAEDELRSEGDGEDEEEEEADSCGGREDEEPLPRTASCYRSPTKGPAADWGCNSPHG